MTRNPSRRRRRRAVPGLRRARRAIRRARSRRKGSAYRYVRRHRMFSNPGGTLGGIIKSVVEVAKKALPIAAALYGTRFLTNTFGYRIPGIDRLGRGAKPAVAALAIVAGHFATRKGPLAKYRGAILLGLGINLVDSVMQAVAPDNVRSMFGLSGAGVYDRAMGEYMQLNDYVQIGDYIEVGAEQDLGALEQELGGLEQELGADDDGLSRPLLGGVPQSAMMAPVGRRQMVAAVPERSFVSQVPGFNGSTFDEGDRLYTGIFGGGFGN